MPATPPLEVRDLSVDLATARGQWKAILSGVSMGAKPGGVTGLLGPSGCGKTTLAVGSSRVDLQACKLEYSIVSPK